MAFQHSRYVQLLRAKRQSQTNTLKPLMRWIYSHRVGYVPALLHHRLEFKSMQPRDACAPQEMSFVASDMALEVIGDVAIVWCLSPRLRLGSRPVTGFTRWLSSLPGSSVQVRLF